jgi:glycosyltransferase involved in cell wall biosynthesis
MKDADAFILSSKWEEMGFVIIEAALSNLFIVSSNCPNGPSEFLNYGKDGILFENNQKDALYQSLLKYNQLEEKIKYKNKIQTKKNSLNFTMFRHFKILNKILSQK